MSRNFIFNARKQGGSARNLNLRCGLGASKRGFGSHRDPGVGRYGHLSGARRDNLGARKHGFLQSTKCRDVGASGHRLLRDTKCYDFVACIDRLFRDIGCCDLSASGYSLSQDIGRRGFAVSKYELHSRANCDYSVSMLLNGAVCCGFDACGLSAQFSAQKAVLSAYRSLFCDASGLGSEQNSAFGAHCVVRNFLNLHDARDFKNFGSVNLKKFNLAASQFVNLKKQIRAGEGTDKSVNSRNLTSFEHETRMLRRLGSESKILAPRRFYFQSAVGAPCGPGLGYRNCEFAQNFKRFVPDFAENFKDFTWSLETEPAQSCKISALNFTRNFKNSARGREAGSMQGFGNSGRNFEPKFPQRAKNSDRNLEAEPAQSFKDQNLAQDFSQNGKSYDQNSTQGFSQSGRSAEPNSKPSFSQNIKNSERNFPLSFLQSAKNSDKSQNFKSSFAQSFKNQNFAWDFSQNGRSYEPNSAQGFSQSSKNSDRNSKANSAQNQTDPVSPQDPKNLEPYGVQQQELGFYAPKFKDERARNFFSHPMRAFVLCACFFAALGALSFLAPDALAINYVGAHKFYFLFLAPSCIYAAFLLTALPDWTNFEGSLKPVSLAFAACLIAAFIASFLNLRLAAAITGLFWAVFFIFAAWLLWLDKNSNNFSILAVLAAFCACSAAYGASADEKFLLSFVHINVAAIAVVSYRISVVIGNEALREGGLKDAVFIPNFIYKNLAAFLAFALALATPFLSEATCGFIALGIGFLFLAKLRELHYVEILSRHYMAFYYALQAACAAGYLWLGAALIRGGYAAAPLHVIAICYIYGAILFVGMIAGQRHSGISPLNFPRLSRAALVLALLAGGLRAVFAGESFVLYVMIPSALFIAAVALYLINFVPIFLKNPFSADPD
ncbi:NnrS family protein [uncultured Campylobacter sp.]|uniref:NnrS family protein n=1 Tax=uncultured Campylobacter sp. TaxID=218934 RepID=UPI00262A270D|nr:NnrS family protein [uncultured Campylobacter sp.]